MTNRRHSIWLAIVGIAFLVQPAQAQYGHGIIGYLDLVERLGDDTPTGAGVHAAQVEVDGGGGYGPNQNGSQFNTKNFTEMSGPAGYSDHANTVAKYQYGTIYSIAPDVADIWLYSAVNWVGSGYLRAGSGGTTLPLPTPGDVKVINNSWIGSLSSPTLDNDALRRADFVVTRDDLVLTSGMNNDGGQNFPLLSHTFNGLSVGLQVGTHTFGDTTAPFDGPGRMKPEIVAAQAFTSFATPMVNAAASLLTETAWTWPLLAPNPNADRSDVLKAVLMAGATHENDADGTWSNEPDTAGPNRGVTARPLDERVGVGTLDINISHLIHTGGEQDGSVTVPIAPTADWAGWDFENVPADESRFWRFRVHDTADEVAAVATWHRNIRLQNGTWTIAEFDLILWRIDAKGDVVSLVGDAGLPYFTAGNVVSESAVDNVEHLYVNDLEAGDYVLELRRQPNGVNENWKVAVAWIFPDPGFAPEDINEDGNVDFDDLLLVLVAWGDCPVPSDCPADVNGDGTVGLGDLLLVLAGWG